MLGICFLLPGSDFKIVIVMCSYLFGMRGLIASIFCVYGLSIVFICIFIRYAKTLLESNVYRKIYEGINTVNKGFALYFVPVA